VGVDQQSDSLHAFVLRLLEIADEVDGRPPPKAD
jgi:hypothetical protein